MKRSHKKMTREDLERLVIQSLADRDPHIARRFRRDAAQLQPSTEVMSHLLEIYAGQCHLSQERATAAWDMAAAAAAQGHPGGDEDDFDLEAAGARFVTDWAERTEGQDIAPLHILTSLRIAVGMYFTACVENRLPSEIAMLACGIMARVWYMDSCKMEIRHDEVEEFFHPWWYRDTMSDEEA